MARAGKRDPLLDSVHVPEGFWYLWLLFWEIRQGASQGFSGAFLTWVDVDAYKRATGTRLSAFEVEAIMSMDNALKGD